MHPTALWLLLARTGLRVGEARALRWSDLDWETGVLVVQRNLPMGALVSKTPKTAAGLRPVMLSSRLLDVLRQHHRLQAVERLRSGGRYADQHLIFCTRYGTPLRAENLLRRFRQLLGHAGLRMTLRLHDLRHTAISHQLAAGLPVPEVSAAAGHASPAVTTHLYAHAVRRAGRSGAEQLEAFYRSTPDPPRPRSGPPAPMSAGDTSGAHGLPGGPASGASGASRGVS